MTEGDEHAEESASRAASPSLSELAERIERRQDRSPRESGTEEPDADAPFASGAPADSEFFFPASDPSMDEGDGPPRAAGRATATRDPETTSPRGSPRDRGESDRGGSDSTERTDSGRERADATGGDDPDRGSPGAPGSAFGNDPKAEAILELVGDVRNLLLSGPPSRPADYDLCTTLLAPGGAVPEHLLLVTFNESPDERLNVLRGHLGSLPGDVAILNVGDATRRGPEAAHTTETGGITIKTIPDATDIQRLGLAINKCLSEMDDDGETALCFHSLTDLLRAVDSESAFRFLNVLLGRVRSGDVRAHYHIDPDAHDEELLATYEPLFDEALRFEEDGSVTVDR